MLLAASLLLLTAQSASPAPASPPSNVVRSEPLKLAYTIPSDLKLQPTLGEESLKAEREKTTGIQRAVADCISLPITAMDDSANFRLLAIMRMDEICMGTPIPSDQLGALATSSLAESLRRIGGDPKLQAPVSYSLADRAASVVSGTAVSEKLSITFHATMACVKLDKNVACWEFLALTPAAVDAMAVLPVVLDGQPSLPVVPVDTLAKTKTR